MPKHLISHYAVEWSARTNKGQIQVRAHDGTQGSVQGIDNWAEFCAVMLILGKSPVLFDDETGDYEVPWRPTGT